MELVSWLSAETPVWALFLVFAGLQITWTLLVRTFPSVLGNVFLKRLDHRLSAKLERTKAELQSAHSTLKTSVDFLSLGQAELRGKVVAAVELLWDMTRAVQREFSGVTSLEMILLPEEITEALQGQRASIFVTAVDDFRHESHLMEIMSRLEAFSIEKSRLFVSDRLWLIVYVTRAVHGRIAHLLQRSFEEGRYLSWRDDNAILSLAGSVFSTELIDTAKGSQIAGLQMILGNLEAEFLKEARRVMSGSQGFADALSDLQSTLRYEQQKIASRLASTT